jgi:hypothetical protein
MVKAEKLQDKKYFWVKFYELADLLGSRDADLDGVMEILM